MGGGVNFWTNCCHFTGCPKKTELIKVVSYKFRFLLSYFKIIQRRYQTIKFNNQGTKFLNISAWDCLMSLPNQPLFLRLMRTRVPTPYFLMCVRSWSRERKINTILNEPVLLLSNRHLSMILLLHMLPLNISIAGGGINHKEEIFLAVQDSFRNSCDVSFCFLPTTN